MSTEAPKTSWIAADGREIVHAAEARICGPGLVASPARAEGFALAGRPAATRVGTDRCEVALSGAWVLHRPATPGAGARKGFAAELVAGSVQEAADHCLVAHRIARAAGRPCLCTLEPGLADEPGFAVLPEPEAIRVLLESPAGNGRGLREVVTRAFEFVSGVTGRECLALTREGDEDAESVLVARGDARRRASSVATALRAAGIRCGVIGVAQIDPFPHEALARLLEGKRRVLVFGPAAAAATLELVAWVRSAAPSSKDVLSVDSGFEPSGDLARVREALELPTDTSTVELPSRRSVLLGIQPATRWADVFLRGVAGRLRELAPLAPHVPARVPEGTAVLGLAEADRSLGVPASQLDLLMLPDLAALERGDALDTLRPGGTVLLYGARTDTGLSAARRAACLAKDLRWLRLPPDETGGDAPTRIPPFAARLAGAVLAALPGVGELVGASKALDALAASGAIQPDEARRAAAGADALATLDTAELEREHEPAASVPPQLPPATPAESDPTWRDALWQFHLTGEGAYSDAEPPAGLSLSPLALATLDPESWEPSYPLQLAEGQPPIELSSATLLALYAAVDRETRAGARREFLDRARTLTARLGELLGNDDTDPGSTTTLAGSLGSVTGAFFDAARLSSMLPRSRPADLPPDRRERMDWAWRTLKSFVAVDEPELIVVHPSELDFNVDGKRVRWIAHEDGLRAAIGIFDSLALSEAVRAMRVAELEVGHCYDPALHDRRFARFDWQSFNAEELRLLPRVVVVETGARLRGAGLAALSELLRSGRPIHVVIAERLAELHDAGDPALRGYHAGLGYLAVAHREAFVTQSSLGMPGHLLDALRRLAKSLRPSVAVVATPDWRDSAPPRLQLAAAHAGRAAPLFVFDPDAGETVAERLDLGGNPHPGATWPRGPVKVLDGDGREVERDETLTFAHAAAVLGEYRRHFRVLPAVAAADDQIDLAAWLELPDGEAHARLPYILVQTGDGRLARAVLSRLLAAACRERARAWRTFQELAERPAATGVVETPGEMEVVPVAAAGGGNGTPVPEADAGEAAVRAAMQRLVQALVDPDGQAMPVLPIPPSDPAPPPAFEPAPQQPAAPPPAPAVVEGPYIDTLLCTTCNECVNLNNRLFVYDENKQAKIGDPAAGTFKQLVQAAEKCPARCIHPGAPRPDDKTATPKLIARAEPFQ